MIAPMIRHYPVDLEQRHTFLLRFWYEPEPGCWRVYLQEANTRDEHVFANFPELVAYLAQRLGTGPTKTVS